MGSIFIKILDAKVSRMGRGGSVGTFRLSFDTSTQKVEGSIPGPTYSEKFLLPLSN